MSYMALKHLHMTTVVITFVLFSLRAAWALMESPQLQRKWVKILPHVNDTVLLLSAIGMTLILQQYPFQAAWLTAKVIGLILYILLGTLAIKRARTPAVRKLSIGGAYLVFFYILGVALTKSPWAWLN